MKVESRSADLGKQKPSERLPVMAGLGCASLPANEIQVGGLRKIDIGLYCPEIQTIPTCQFHVLVHGVTVKDFGR